MPRDRYEPDLPPDAAGTVGPIAAAGQNASTQPMSGPPPRLQPPRQWPKGFSLDIRRDIALPDGVATRMTPQMVAGTHCNFYEFRYGSAGDVWPKTKDFIVDPWTIEITGLCAKPMTLGLEEIDAFPHEQRLYHFRCVERWAMNVPWVGFPLRDLLAKVEPKSEAKYVRFVTANRPEQMPEVKELPRAGWPYEEGLRIDEAMNELAFVVTGVYGQPLVKQHGAPIRIVVPWKYGYKNPKSIVKIELTAEQPQTYWNDAQPHEYGFLSNVNPNIPHPRWSQQQSWWIGEARSGERFPTPIFNGYGKYVSDLYPDEPRESQQPLKPGQMAR